MFIFPIRRQFLSTVHKIVNIILYIGEGRGSLRLKFHVCLLLSNNKKVTVNFKIFHFLVSHFNEI